MQFVDEFRDPELAKSLLQRLQKVMENQPHFYSSNLETQTVSITTKTPHFFDI